MENSSNDEIITSCEFIFEKFLHKDVKGKIKNVKTSRWKTDDQFLGTYSYQSEDDSSITLLAEPLCDSNGRLKVLFAGEATHEYFFSTVHGAIESGLREAKRLIDLY